MGARHGTEIEKRALICWRPCVRGQRATGHGMAESQSFGQFCSVFAGTAAGGDLSAEKTYRIGEVAELLNVKTSLLRFWETEFPQIAPLRTETGHRVYTEKHIALLRRIQQLLHEQGWTIEGARRVLDGSAIVDENPPERIIAVPDPAFMGMLTDELLAIRDLLARGGER